MTEVLDKKYTIEEYLTLERKAAVKHEFYNGNIVEMPGGTVYHNLIANPEQGRRFLGLLKLQT